MRLKPYYSEDGIVIYQGDCLDILPRLSKVDHVITDPPYEDEAHNQQRRQIKHPTEKLRYAPLDFPAITEDQRESFGALTSEMTRRWCLTFCQIEASQRWAQVYEPKLRYMRTCIWVKTGAIPQFTGDRPGMGYETIVAMHAVGKRSVWNGGGRVGVFKTLQAPEKRAIHQTTKPLPLMRELVGLFTDPGETILDPFMGSGTTLRAAKELGRKAIGIELEEKWCELAVKRLKYGNVKNIDGIGLHAKACRYPMLDCICHLMEKK